MSFAIIETGGKQYKVSASKILEIEKLNAKKGETIGMIGKFKAYNVVAAASICVAIGIDPNLIFKSKLIVYGTL